MEISFVGVAGALVVLAAARHFLRSVSSQINIAPLSEQWLAEQKLARHWS